jgi:drug/metabolite transporter superfamily protein YnfA
MMVSGLMMWVIGLFICIGAFLNGLWFSRTTKNPWAGKSILGIPIEGAGMSVQEVRRSGRMYIIFAALFLIFWTLMMFGFVGPVEGIETIKLL